MSHLSLLAQRILNVPLAVHPAKAEVVLAALADRLGITHIERSFSASLGSDLGFEEPGRGKLGYEVAHGIACIPIEGMLVQKSGYVRPISGLTGYDGVRANFLGALADEGVRAIVLDLNSGGGEVSGCFDLADTIYACRGIKPIWAICGDSAYSAAYALASACDRITVPRTGGVGSVGIITMLVDMSQAISKAGLAVHFVHTGERKAETMRAETQGVSPDLLGRLQADIDTVGQLFFDTVARNRSLSTDAVRDMQGGYYLGIEGVRAGLADAVMAPDEAIEALLTSLD